MILPPPGMHLPDDYSRRADKGCTSVMPQIPVYPLDTDLADAARIRPRRPRQRGRLNQSNDHPRPY